MKRARANINKAEQLQHSALIWSDPASKHFSSYADIKLLTNDALFTEHVSDIELVIFQSNLFFFCHKISMIQGSKGGRNGRSSFRASGLRYSVNISESVVEVSNQALKPN